VNNSGDPKQTIRDAIDDYVAAVNDGDQSIVGLSDCA
jgi:hypothetical protein